MPPPAAARANCALTRRAHGPFSARAGRSFHMQTPLFAHVSPGPVKCWVDPRKLAVA
jgi:hypothetical protein